MGTPRHGSFPFPTSLSLDSLIGYWASHRNNPDSPLSAQAESLMSRLDVAPELRGRITDPNVIERHRRTVDELMSVVFPIADEMALGGVGEPFRFSFLYETPAAQGLGLFSEQAYLHGTEHDQELMERGHIVAAYEQILQKTYRRSEAFDYPLVVSVDDAQTGLQRHFQFSWDSRFFHVVPRGELPRPTEDQLKQMIGEPTNFELWTDILPPDRFELSGLAIVRATEVTMREAVSRLKDDLLEHEAMATPARIDRLQGRIRTILGMPDVRVGLIGFERSDGIDAIDTAFAVGRSLLLSAGVAPDCTFRAESNYAEVFKHHMPVVARDLESGEHMTGFEYHLMETGLRSLLVQPLFIGDRLIGLLEVASPHAGELTAFSAFKLTDVAGPFATALQHRLDERDDRIQSIIKRRYTAIHPSVEWRFREAAARLMGEEGEDGQTPVADEIVFKGVYPLYGLTDIRGSSDTRSRAIQCDLVEQLRLALDVVQEAGKRPSFPVLDQIAYRIGLFLSRIEAGLHSEDETAAIGFLERELEPILDQLAEWDEGIAARVETYREALHPDLGVLYRSRKSFDDSVTRFNETVSAVIDREEDLAQEVFPHFFEKFQTDGVDYNVYIGESLVENGGFSRLYLQNLRLWQLKLICRIEWELDRVRPELGVDLAPTHLILVQDQPLAIRFRTDEKRFDVDGAYNIRYELVKKRIDKARIRHSGERLTQPGMLAVVYSQAHEAQEYRRYLEFLTTAGYFTGEIEEHELEDMQGVLGLRAFRVAINEEASERLRGAEARVELGEVERIG